MSLQGDTASKYLPGTPQICWSAITDSEAGTSKCAAIHDWLLRNEVEVAFQRQIRDGLAVASLLRNGPIVACIVNTIGCRHKPQLIVRQSAMLSTSFSLRNAETVPSNITHSAIDSLIRCGMCAHVLGCSCGFSDGRS